MSEQEKLERMRSIPGFVEMPEGWADRVKLGSKIVKVHSTLDGDISRDELTVSNVGKKMLTTRSADGVAGMVSRKGWNYATTYNYFYWVEINHG